ncbi:dipeptide ABC transporter ATP-binding protein [Aeriscardovia aeriphila]|uniref:ABC transporter ATP-binding protein n=1 Tax=Aeriscardovia aeriphila TaxID=218139 RepID=A0A261FCF5_9BIFI|nr:ABC transporter ATP-binding protein [Aeriscardovia aeriphila]NYI26284.1 peptide/nickel transport system ATP-binding protein [Aeriscardovia aeriphila]OZG56830.1 ABC transporter ATP-binding protein [Aeriscardovia aeriphila]
MATDSTREPLLTVSHVSIGFDGTPVTHDVHFSLFPGTITALVGESGSGKSVSAMALAHLDPSQAEVSGQAFLGSNTTLNILDNTLDQASLQKLRGGQIGVVFQEPMTAFNPLMTLGKQVEESLIYHQPKLSKQERKEAVLHAFEAVRLPQPERIFTAHPHELSGGQLQRVMIAMAIINNPSIIIADEPTTALDVTTQKAILQLLEGLARERHLAILIITHDMGVVWEAAQYVYVMQKGRIVEEGSTRQIFTAPTHPYTRMLLDAVPKLTVDSESEASPTADSQAPALVQLEHVSLSYSHRAQAKLALHDISLRIGAGETLALVGESGAGKTTIGKVISGQLTPQQGTVLIGGDNLAGLKGKKLRQARSSIGFVFQNSSSALVPTKTIGWSIAEPLLVEESLGGTKLSSQQRRERVEELMKHVGLDPALASRFPYQLSGGQRQRVGIARAIALRPKLLIADEPTSSLDVTVQKRVLDLLRTLQQEYGYACLFITHDLGIVQEVAHNLAVIKSGEIVEQGSVSEVLAHPRHAYTRTLLDASPRIDISAR